MDNNEQDERTNKDEAKPIDVTMSRYRSNHPYNLIDCQNTTENAEMRRNLSEDEVFIRPKFTPIKLKKSKQELLSMDPQTVDDFNEKFIYPPSGSTLADSLTMAARVNNLKYPCETDLSSITRREAYRTAKARGIERMGLLQPVNCSIVSYNPEWDVCYKRNLDNILYSLQDNHDNIMMRRAKKIPETITKNEDNDNNNGDNNNSNDNSFILLSDLFQLNELEEKIAKHEEKFEE